MDAEYIGVGEVVSDVPPPPNNAPTTYTTPNYVCMQRPYEIKAQWIRLADVALIGPLMFVGGVSLSKDRPFWGVLLGALGLGTMAFNARNFWLVYQADRQQNPRQQ